MSGCTMNPVGYGVITSYRVGKARQFNNYLLIKVVSSTYSKVDALIGCKVLVRDGAGNEYRGKIVRIHSRRNNVVVARMRRGIPGQLLGSSLIILK
ncbi:MAG: hypothetical protein QXN19_00375 [Sulfolobales archaeon]